MTLLINPSMIEWRDMRNTFTNNTDIGLHWSCDKKSDATARHTVTNGQRHSTPPAFHGRRWKMLCGYISQTIDFTAGTGWPSWEMNSVSLTPTYGNCSREAERLRDSETQRARKEGEEKITTIPVPDMTEWAHTQTQQHGWRLKAMNAFSTKNRLLFTVHYSISRLVCWCVAVLVC